MKNKIKFLLQKIGLFRDKTFWANKIKKDSINLRDKIIKETNWIASETNFGKDRKKLPFHEQAIKYYEYKNMVIQIRTQYVIIFLSMVLLLMTDFQIYLEFSNN